MPKILRFKPNFVSVSRMHGRPEQWQWTCICGARNDSFTWRIDAQIAGGAHLDSAHP